MKNKTPVFVNNFSSQDDVLSEYRVDGLSKWQHNCSEERYEQLITSLKKKYKILFADYTYEDYSGDSYVLGWDKEEKKYFEVHGSHCSCYGLEDQWTPEYYESLTILKEVIKKRYEAEENRSWYYRRAEASEELKDFLGF